MTYADERAAGSAFIASELDRMCHDLGLDPWETWRRPRHHERLAAVRATSAAIRAGAQVRLGLRPRDERGRFVGGAR